MRRRLEEWGLTAVVALAIGVGVALVERRAAADEPAATRGAGTLCALADDAAALQAQLEAGERLTWTGPAHRSTLVLRLGKHLLLLERGLRAMEAQVTVRRDGAFLLVEGPATLRREQDREGSRRLDATTLLGLPWGAPPDVATPPVEGDSSHLEMIEGDASISKPAVTTAVSVNSGEQAPLVVQDAASLGEFAEGKVEVGGSHLTLLEHTSLRVLSIGETSSVVEVLGVQLELQRGTIIEAAFGSLVLNLKQGAAAVRPGSGTEIPEIRITNLDPGTGILTTTTVRLEPGQEFGVGPTGVWTTPGSGSPVSVTVTLSVPVYDESGQLVGRETVTTFDGQAPVGTGPSVPVLVDAIARVMGGSSPEQVGALVGALANGTSVTDLGLQSLVTNYTGDPALVDAMQGALSHMGTSTSSGDTSSGQTGTPSGGGGSGDGASGTSGDTQTADSGGTGGTGGERTSTVDIYFSTSMSSGPGDGLSGGGANGAGDTPQSIDQTNSQNSTGTNTIVNGDGTGSQDFPPPPPFPPFPPPPFPPPPFPPPITPTSSGVFQ